jgi:hypothetical protein
VNRGGLSLSREAVGNAVLFLLALVWIAASAQLRYGSLFAPGPAFLPVNLGVVMAAISGAALVRELLKAEADESEVHEPVLVQDEAGLVDGVNVQTDPDVVRKIVVTTVATIAFVGIVGPLGYGIAMTGLMVTYFLVGGIGILRSSMWAIGGTLVSWLIFEGLLGLPLPGRLLDTLIPI